MEWPTYPTSTDTPEILAWQSAKPDLSRRIYTAAVDVWRDGGHLWRSYGPEFAETCDSWADRELGPDVARNFDEGMWSAPGLVSVDMWPIPMSSALAPVGTAADLRNLLCTVLAIGQYPHHPTGLDVVPKSNTISTKLWRSEKGVIVIAAEAEGVTIRAMVAQRELRDLSATVTWNATLTRRELRPGATDHDLGPDKTVTFQAPESTKPSALVRLAKQSCGIPGWQARRIRDTLEWHLARAPYNLTISKA